MVKKQYCTLQSRDDASEVPLERMAPVADAASEKKPLLPALELDAKYVLHVDEFGKEACLKSTFYPRIIPEERVTVFAE